MKRSFLLLCAMIALIAAGCLGPARRPTLPPPPLPEIPVKPPLPPEVSIGAAASFLWAVAPGQDPLAAAEFLSARPELRLTVLLPERFFNEEDSAKKAKPLFTEMVARGQLEVLLTLPDRPVLALIHDSDSAKLSTMTASLPLPSRFHRPEDAAGQVALAKSFYRRRWRVSPTGFAVPWGAAIGPELEPVAKAGVRWLYLGAAKDEVGACQAGGLPALTARTAVSVPRGEEARRDWFRWAVSTENGRPPLQISTLGDLSTLSSLPGVRWVTVGESLKDLPRPDRACPPSDLSSFIGEPEENRAWQLLGLTRQALEDFKNSGRAEVQTLDRATREIYGAENGDTFFALGNEGSAARTGEVKREFLASLEQVYRFLGAPPPPALRQGFSGSGETAGSGDATDSPFFHREGAALRWRDEAKDDRGPGDFYYPTGAGFPTGAWDLLSFRVDPGSSDVVFRWGFAALANPGGAPHGFSLELVDTYIDINHLPGAGEERLLPGRPGLVEPQNAWEYALSVDGWGARLYQGTRRLAVLPVKVVPPATIEVSVPLKYLRGDPASWGFAVAVMGRSPDSPGGSEPAPMAVLEQPGPDHFGGAMKGLTAPPFIDILSEGPEQNEVLSAYKQGREAVLPFVRADE